MNSPVSHKDRKKITLVTFFLSFLFCLLIVRFYQIQITEGDLWTKEALAQHQHVVTIPFMRGSFYSNTSVKKGHPDELHPFVVDIAKFHLYIDPASIPAPLRSKMGEELALKIPKRALVHQNIAPEFQKKSRSRKIAVWLDRGERDQIEAWWRHFAKEKKLPKNALFFSSEFQRSYPFGSLLGSVLHTVRDEKDPHTHQSLPTGGLEMLFDRYLQGKAGKKVVLRSPRHQLDTVKVIEPAEHGSNIYLTINHYLQAIAESELKKGVQITNAKGGWAVMMDPNTGEILALAQTPSFDPGRYADYFNDPALLDSTKVKAVTDCFEPGSIFKPITVALAMKANEELQAMKKGVIFTPEEKIATSNGWFPGRSTPLKDVGRVHHYLNLDLAMQKSSNIYMARLVQRITSSLGDAWYRKTLGETFGFGMKTGVELPAEAFGLLPTPGKLHPNGKLEWSLPTPYSLAIGHNLLVNSIQMVRAYAILANGGKMVQPHLVRKIVKPKPEGSSQVLFDHASIQSNKQVLSPAICKRVVHAMKFVTKEGGTARRADIMGYTEVGKTGTSEKIINGVYSKDHHIASFLGFAPAENPRFVLLVALDDPEKKFVPGMGRQQFGGVSAAPIFREIASKALAYLGVTPNDPFGYPLGDPRRDPARADFAHEVAVLKELYSAWNEH
jgi:cell division protein FtsI (penicillin-binding protein 3)